MSQHFLQSTYRERLIEHLFVGELLKHSWTTRACALEIARPEVDNSGYDLIAVDGKIVRYIQLKAAHRGAKASRQNVHLSLLNKPGGCVVWVMFDESTLELGPFHYFGGKPGEPLPDLATFKTAKHTKRNSNRERTERPNIRVVPKTKFEKLATVPDVYDMLFGSSRQVG